MPELTMLKLLSLTAFFLFPVGGAAFKKQDTSGQAKASGSAGRSILESLERKRKADEISACQDEVIARSWAYLWRWTWCLSGSWRGQDLEHLWEQLFLSPEKETLNEPERVFSATSLHIHTVHFNISTCEMWVSIWCKYPTEILVGHSPESICMPPRLCWQPSSRNQLLWA